jgi:hypothetical protein
MFNREQDAINNLVEDEMDDLEYPTAPMISTIWVDSSRDAKEFKLTLATGALLEDLKDSTMEARELANRSISVTEKILS